MEINAPDGERPIWRESPFRIHGDDVAVVPIELPTDAAYEPVNSWEPLDYYPRIGDTVMIVGFPSGLIGASAGLPIAKSGFIASNPYCRQKGHFRFLIDARTYSGMSGAPIFLNQVLSLNGSIGMRQDFLGVYSGRLVLPDEAKASEFGYCWSWDFVKDVCGVWGVEASLFSPLTRLRDSEDREDGPPDLRKFSKKK